MSKHFEVVSPYNGANVGAFTTRGPAEDYAAELNEKEAAKIDAYHAKQAAWLRGMKLEHAARLHEREHAVTWGYWVHHCEAPEPINESVMEEAIGPYTDADPGL